MVIANLCPVPTFSDDPELLCHVQLVQAILVDLITQYPQWFPRYEGFRQRYAREISNALQKLVVSADRLIDQLVAVTGTPELSESQHKLHNELWSTSTDCNLQIGGGIEDWMPNLVGFVEHCFPRGFQEWLALADRVYDVHETREAMEILTTLVLQVFERAVKEGCVAMNIGDIAAHDPKRAFAICLTLFADVVASSQLSWPTDAEVTDFAAMCQPPLIAMSAAHRTTLALLLQDHPMYCGRREQRANRENPFAFVLRTQMASQPISRGLQPEVNAEGRLTGLRVINRPSQQLATLHIDENTGVTDVEDRLLAATVPESKVARRNRGGTVTEYDRKIVWDAIKAYKTQHQKKEPGFTELKQALKGRGAGSQKLQAILAELRLAGKYSLPGRPRNNKRPNTESVRSPMDRRIQ